MKESCPLYSKTSIPNNFYVTLSGVYLYQDMVSHCSHSIKGLIATSCILDYWSKGKLHDFISSLKPGVGTGSAATYSPFYNNCSSFFSHLSACFRKHKIFLRKMNYLSILCKKLIWNIIKKAINPHLKLIA